MKFAASLLLLATSVLGQLQARGDYGYGHGHGHGHGNSTTTLVTYTTVTVCPVTSTYTNAGSTYCVTELTTSTITVTECHGCVTTVQAPDYTKTEHDVEYVTKTTVCPVTETETVSGKEVTVVYTTTSVYVEIDHSTAYEQVTQPGKTNYETEVEYTTRTTVCPVTVTTTIEGKPTTYVYTTTSVIEEAVHTTEYAEVTKPGPTEYETEVDYTTRTTVCPVTVTTVVEGKPTTYVTTTTSVIEEAVHTTAYEVISKPGGTEYETEVQYATHTTLCPVTETTVIEGKETTIVYTVTSTIEEAVRTTVYEKVQQPDVTKSENEVAYVTETSLCPVTETLTISGEVITKVYTSTQYLVTQIKTTINEYQTVYQTASNVEVYTYYSKVYLTVGGGTVVETIVPQTTVQITQTEVATKPVVTYTSVATPVASPTEVITGAANAHRPAFALMAGLVGVLALL